MPPVTATLVHADWLIRWSATRMAFATATPPLYSSCSSVPASCCHWARLTGSLRDRRARGDGLLDGGQILLHGARIPAGCALYLARYAGVRM